MTLEDHAGDVVGKARKGLGVAPAQVAEAGGLSDVQYARFEEHGTYDELPDLVKIGELLQLNPDKLATIASGWYCLLYTSPSPRDGLLSRMPSSA